MYCSDLYLSQINKTISSLESLKKKKKSNFVTAALTPDKEIRFCMSYQDFAAVSSAPSMDTRGSCSSLSSRSVRLFPKVTLFFAAQHSFPLTVPPIRLGNDRLIS